MRRPQFPGHNCPPGQFKTMHDLTHAMKSIGLVLRIIDGRDELMHGMEAVQERRRNALNKSEEKVNVCP
jgi:hypothetical protein